MFNSFRLKTFNDARTSVNAFATIAHSSATRKNTIKSAKRKRSAMPPSNSARIASLKRTWSVAPLKSRPNVMTRQSDLTSVKSICVINYTRRNRNTTTMRT